MIESSGHIGGDGCSVVSRSSLVGEDEGSYRPKWYDVVIMKCHRGRYEPSYRSTKELHGCILELDVSENNNTRP